MRWMWIDRITDLVKGERCVAVKNVSLAEEHLHDHFPAEGERRAQPVMPGSLITEGMAQTAGILVGHARDFKEKVVLAKIAKASFELDITPGQTLIYSAQLERIDDSGARTAGTVEVVGPAGVDDQRRAVGQIDLMFSHIDQNMSGLDFPEHNFIFHDQFFDLLINSGFPVEPAQ